KQSWASGHPDAVVWALIAATVTMRASLLSALLLAPNPPNLRPFESTQQAGMGMRASRRRGVGAHSSSLGRPGIQTPCKQSWASGHPDAVVWALIATNLAVFAAWHTQNQTVMARNFMVSVNAMYEGRYHTLLTSAISHREGRHLLFNMLGLYFFGCEVARMYGPRYLLGLYMSGAVVASLAHVFYFQYIVPRTDVRMGGGGVGGCVEAWRGREGAGYIVGVVV
ncbi:unnamed protein product, partial [Closterium sp. NIES-54]